MNPNLLIEASAGTGKTQALAERLIALVRAGLKPHEIVALTFSRAAAGEIFERFVSLLAEKAETDASDAALLREVIATQHLSLIGTLDSFLMRIVRSFPLELGLGGDVEIMDDYRAGVERAKASFSILRRTDPSTKRAFADAFALAMNREDVRSFVASYRDFIMKWHELVLSHPDASAWGDPAAIWRGARPDGLGADEADLARAADAVAATCGGDGAVLGFAEWVRGFRGGFSGVVGLAKKFLEKDDLFDGAAVEVSFRRRQYSFAGAAAEAVRTAMSRVYGYSLRMKLELARGVFALMSQFESVYAKTVRGRGRLVFADVPRLVVGLPDDARLAIEYRMDARLRAWALDEFQDTSREQWMALGPLVEEAKQSGGEKGVFIVGDRKQAIYGWRNGDVGIFERERASGAYETGALNATYRSGPAVVSAVNAVFVKGPLKDDFPTWTSPEHATAKPELGGFVQRVEAEGTSKADFVEPVFNALKAVDPVARGISAAILVRYNAFGEMLAAELKQRGLAGVVWEGESAVYDTPALGGFLDLVALADHPGDSRAYAHFATTPLARAKFPDGVPAAEELSVAAAHAFTSRGLVRVFRELRAALPDDPAAAWSAFTEARFTDLLRAASEFELAMEPGMRLSDFAAFLAAKKVRNVAEPGRIKVMTIHRSKGLGFDYVVLPLYEHEALNSAADGPLVADGWVLPDPGPRVTRAVPGLSDAQRLRQDRVEQEELCAYYVAMTRAKRAMTIVTQPPPKGASESRRFSDYVRESMAEEIGDRTWYREPPPSEGAARARVPAAVQPPPALGQRQFQVRAVRAHGPGVHHLRRGPEHRRGLA
ncbi:MAG: UvrD-helicase domain-containing protein, partial [Kiritimatiellae bacterium]|nr:UvrD-helicase domain-containing protein [Kiritimatiellia bacterium]